MIIFNLSLRDALWIKRAPYYLILSFLRVLEEFPQARLVLAGDGSLWSTCKNLISYYGLEENVELPGVIAPVEFRSFLKESLALVQHSVTAESGDTEGTPVAILEACAAGLPVISTKHAGIPDVIQEGENGFLTYEHDVEGMAESMIKLLRTPSLAKEMGMKGRILIKEKYSLQKHIDKLNELILSCSK